MNDSIDHMTVKIEQEHCSSIMISQYRSLKTFVNFREIVSYKNIRVLKNFLQKNNDKYNIYKLIILKYLIFTLLH